MRKIILTFIMAMVFIAVLASCTATDVKMLMNELGISISDQEAIAIADGYNARLEEERQARQFLSFAAALHDEPFLVCTRAHESDTAGGYVAVSASGTYRGAYQFSQSTWNSTASHAGWGHLYAVDPITVGVFWQDAMAWHLYGWQGASPWLGRCAGL